MRRRRLAERRRGETNGSTRVVNYTHRCPPHRGDEQRPDGTRDDRDLKQRPNIRLPISRRNPEQLADSAPRTTTSM